MSVPEPIATQPIEVRLDIDQQTALLALAIASVMKAMSDIEAARLYQRYQCERAHDLKPNVRSITFGLEVIGLAYVKAVTAARDQRLAQRAEPQAKAS